MFAHRRRGRTAASFVAASIMVATIAVGPASVAARATGTPSLDHTTASRVGSITPRRDGVVRTASGGNALLGVPQAAGGGAGALRALRRPDATAPPRFNLPHWLPAVGNGARTNAASGHVVAAVGRLAATTTTTPVPTDDVVPIAAAAPTTGLRSSNGMFGIADSDDSLLYGDCSLFELCEEPPDPGIAVSATDIVQSVNELIMIVDRATNASRVVPNFDFFALDNNQTTQSDPRVLYDQGRNRWLATEISSDCDHGYLHLAVSASGDPFGSWTQYRIVFPGRVVDFPGVGTNDDTVIVSLNTFAPAPDSDCLSAGDFTGGMLAVVDWSDLTSTVPTLPVTLTTPVPGLFTWRPAIQSSPDALGRLVMAIDTGSDDTADVGYATVSGTNAAKNVSVSPVVDLTKTAGLAPFRTPPSPRQPGDNPTISAAVDGDATDAIAAAGRLWFIATAPCTPAGDKAERDCVRLTGLTTGVNPGDVSVASDQLFSENGLDLYMGGVGRALDGTLYVVYSRSSSVDDVAGYATWRTPDDRAFHAPVLIIPGAGPYSGDRWGDYVILAPDPAAKNAIWQADEVPSADGSWFTWVSQLRPAAAGPLMGSFRLNGGDRFVSESFVDLQLANPADVAATVVRAANGPDMKNGVLVGGQTMPIANDLPWSLDVDAPNDTAPDGTRTVYVQWGDGLGHWSDVATETIVLDTTGPTMGRVLAPDLGTSILGPGGSIPITLRWGGGKDALSGLEGYDIEVSVDDNDFEDFASTSRPSVSSRVDPNHTYLFRVRSFDRLGNVSDWVESPPTKITVLDDGSTSITYDRGWKAGTAGAAYRGTEHDARVDGATATFRFTGRTIALVGTTFSGAAHGALTVFIDGRRAGTFTETSTTAVDRRIGFRATVKPGTHAVRIVASGAGGRAANLDAVIVVR